MGIALAIASCGIVAAVVYALWQRSEKNRALDRCAFVAARGEQLEKSLLLEAEGRADDVKRLENVIAGLREDLSDADRERMAWLRDHPSDAGRYLAGVLSNLPPSADVSDTSVVPDPAATGKAPRTRKPRGK